MHESGGPNLSFAHTICTDICKCLTSHLGFQEEVILMNNSVRTKKGIRCGVSLTQSSISCIALLGALMEGLMPSALTEIIVSTMVTCFDCLGYLFLNGINGSLCKRAMVEFAIM